MNPSLFQIIRPAEPWKRQLFNGLAQVIIQATAEEGEIILTGSSDRLKRATLIIKSTKANPRPLVP
jgi:beta-galactosidase